MPRAAVPTLVVLAFLVNPDVGAAQGLSVAIGKSTLDRDSPRAHEPLTASVRFGMSQLAVEFEWMSRTYSEQFIDSGPSRVLSLNGQLGEYGRTTRQSNYTREAAAAILLLRSQPNRVTGWGGVGVAAVRSSARHQSTWTGCSGPWVPHCTTGNYDYTNERTEMVPQVVGGADFRITRWVDVFSAGRAAMVDGGFDAGIAGGVRMSIVPERRDGPRAWATLADGRELTGRLVSRSDDAVTLRQPGGDIVLPASNVRLLEKSDSIVEGAIWGLAFGTLAGWEIRSQGSHRGLAGAMLAGAGIGMAIDELIVGRRVLK